MPVKVMCAVFFRFVALAKTRQIGRHHTVSRFQKDRQHFSIEVTPCGVAMQTQPSDGRICWALVQVVHAQAVQAGQVADVLRGPGVVGQVFKPLLGGAQGIFPQTGVGGLLLVLLALRLEKILQQGAGFFGPHPARGLGLVVELRMVKQIQHRARRAGFRLCGTPHDTFQPRMQHRARTHGARLQGHIQGAIVQAVIAQFFSSCAQGQDLGMGAGVVQTDRGVVRLRHHFTVLHHHRAHRHLPGFTGCLGLLQGQAHEIVIELGHGCLVDWRSHDHGDKFRLLPC